MYCENCGKKLIRGYQFCMECGTPVPPEADDEDQGQEQDAQQSETQQESGMPGIQPLGSDEGTLVYCPTCGMRMQKSTDHCEKCGMRLAGNSPTNSGVPLVNSDPLGGDFSGISDNDIAQINSFVNNSGFSGGIEYNNNFNNDGIGYNDPGIGGGFGGGNLSSEIEALNQQFANLNSTASDMPAISAPVRQPDPEPAPAPAVPEPEPFSRRVDNFSMEAGMPETQFLSESGLPVINGGEIPHEGELVASLKAAGAVSVILNENRERTNVIMGRRFRTLYGYDTLTDELCGLRFEISPAAFFQVNPAQTEVLYQTALDFAELTGDERLCDVYCGAGTITLMMARHCREALGIEIVPQAIENAKENAVRNGIGNVNFRCGAAEALLPKLVAEGLRPDVIVIDPPRKGVEPAVIDAIAQAAPKRVVYVSCNVATQARDAALFVEKGYRVQKVQSVDMFCWTNGVETVMSLVQQNPDDIVKVGIDADELAVTKAESKATYGEIQARVKEQTGLNVTPLYIAQVKRKHGIIERECYNKAKSESAKMLICPTDKEKAIEDALRFFGMIA